MKLVFLLGLALVSPSFQSEPCPWLDVNLQRWSDPSTWKERGGVLPKDGESVVVENALLLDTETARLDTLSIRNGGSLVFSPDVDLAKLTAGVVKIQENGYLLIGGPECRFLGRAEVLLLGEVGADTTFGHYTKGIYVEDGGTLEIHGEEKLSWTKL